MSWKGRSLQWGRQTPLTLGYCSSDWASYEATFDCTFSLHIIGWHPFWYILVLFGIFHVSFFLHVSLALTSPDQGKKALYREY